MPTAAPSSKATSSKERFSHLTSFRARVGGSAKFGPPAHYLRAVVDARLAERERMLRRQIADTLRLARELSR